MGLHSEEVVHIHPTTSIDMTPLEELGDCHCITLHQFITKDLDTSLTKSILRERSIDPNSLDFLNDFWVVHGTVKLLDGRRVAHSWIEVGNHSVEASNNNRDIKDISDYENEHFVEDKIRFSPIQVIDALMRGFGPHPWLQIDQLPQRLYTLSIYEVYRPNFLLDRWKCEKLPNSPQIQ